LGIGEFAVDLEERRIDSFGEQDRGDEMELLVVSDGRGATCSGGAMARYVRWW
jgi:hypothetical protein